jgi:hypothetical protein
MKDASEWLIVCFALLVFAILVGLFGGFVAGDLLALQVSLVLTVIVAIIALLKARKAKL